MPSRELPRSETREAGACVDGAGITVFSGGGFGWFAEQGGVLERKAADGGGLRKHRWEQIPERAWKGQRKTREARRAVAVQRRVAPWPMAPRPSAGCPLRCERSQVGQSCLKRKRQAASQPLNTAAPTPCSWGHQPPPGGTCSPFRGRDPGTGLSYAGGQQLSRVDPTCPPW